MPHPGLANPAHWENDTVPNHHPGLVGLLVLAALQPTAEGRVMRPYEVGNRLLVHAYGAGTVLNTMTTEGYVEQIRSDGINAYKLSPSGLFWLQYWFHNINRTARALDDYHLAIGRYLDPYELLLTVSNTDLFSPAEVEAAHRLCRFRETAERDFGEPVLPYLWRALTHTLLRNSKSMAIARFLCYHFQWPVDTVNTLLPCACANCRELRRIIVHPQQVVAGLSVARLFRQPGQ